jgi:hypothetical protein
MSHAAVAQQVLQRKLKIYLTLHFFAVNVTCVEALIIGVVQTEICFLHESMLNVNWLPLFDGEALKFM